MRLRLEPKPIGRLLGGVCLAALALLAGWTAGRSAEGPRIRFDKLTHDFGEVRPGDKASFGWVFHNDGDAPLEIVSTRTSCGCTLSMVEGSVVPPGGKSKIQVTFDSVGQSGRVRKTLSIVSNDPTRQMTRLTIYAEVPRIETPVIEGGHPPISGRSLLADGCADCHAAPASGKSGQALFDAICAMCHGPDATGARAPSLREPSYLNGHDDEDLTTGIAFGTANPRMPGFSEVMGGPLSDDQVRSLVRLLRDWGPAPSPN